MASTRILLAALALVAMPAQAQTKWDMPTPYSEGEFHTRNVKQFAEDVKKNSNGALDITVHSNQSLIKHADVLRAVSTQQVSIAEFLLGQFSNEDPVFAADNVPFVAPGYDSAWKFYQAQKPVLEKKLQGRGLKLLYAVAWPGQGLYTKDPAKSISDLKGLKMRTYSPLTSRLAEPRGWEMSKAREKEGDEALAKNGVSVSDASPEMKSALAKIGEQMAAEWEKSAGADGQSILKAYRGK